MPAGYGYTKPKYGASLTPPAKPLPRRTLAAAVAGTPTAGDPFGLLNPNPNTKDGPRVPNINGSVISPAKTQSPQAPVATPPTQVQTQAQPASAPTPAAYDVNSDVALQQVNAYTGMNDEQVTAAAAKQRRDSLLAFGDPNLTAAVLGAGDPYVAASGQNPAGTVQRLGHQRETTLHDLLDQLTTGGHNLGYGGYRVNQESELERQFQLALADAGSQEQAQLGGIDAALSAALSANQMSRLQALGQAHDRQIAAALANPPVADASAAPPSATPPPGGNNAYGLPGGASFLDANDPNVDRLALALAARTRRPVGY